VKTGRFIEMVHYTHIRTILVLLILIVSARVCAESICGFETSALGDREESLMEAFDRSPMGGEEGWKLKKNEGGIKVYVRKTDVSPIKAFRGVMVLRVDMATLVAFLMDDESAPEWAPLCEESKVVDKANETAYYVHQVTRLPRPLKARDSVVFKYWCQDPETGVVSAKVIAVPDYIPKRKGFVRMPLILTYFRLIPRDDDTVEFVWEAIIDPAGWIPPWFVNLTLVRAPYDTFRRIQDLMPLEKYQDKSIPWLQVQP
jgi:hypothetical protein